MGKDVPVPAEYERASAQFYAYLVDARDNAGLWSTHVAFTMTQGVLQTFAAAFRSKTLSSSQTYCRFV